MLTAFPLPQQAGASLQQQAPFDDPNGTAAPTSNRASTLTDATIIETQIESARGFLDFLIFITVASTLVVRFHHKNEIKH